MGVITKVELINFMCHDNLTCVGPSSASCLRPSLRPPEGCMHLHRLELTLPAPADAPPASSSARRSTS